MRLLGWLLLMPFAGAAWPAIKAVDICIKRGMRALGFVICLLLGSFCIGLGYFLAYEGYMEWRGAELFKVTYPVAGWIGMVIGGIAILIGTWRSVAVTKEQVELEELTERLERERKEEERNEAKKIAKGILEQGMIDNYETLDWICDALARDRYDFESAELLDKLKKLKEKQARAN